MLGDLADMKEAVRPGKDFHEGAEIHQANHLAQIDLAHFRLGSEVLDDLNGLSG